MSTNTRIALLISMMVNAVIFGAGAVTVLSIPHLSERAPFLLPVVIAASFLLSPFVARIIAPRMRSQRWQARHKLDGSPN